MLDPQPRSELAGPRVGRFARPMRQGDRIGQVGMRRAPRGHDAAHVRPVVGTRRAVVGERPEAGVRDMTRQVVVVAGMVVVRIHRGTHRVDHGQMMGLAGQKRQVLAEPNPRRRRGDRPERPAVLGRCVRFEVPRVDVRRPATEKKQDRRPCRRGDGLGRLGDRDQPQPRKSSSRGHEEGPAIHTRRPRCRVIVHPRLSLARLELRSPGTSRRGLDVNLRRLREC